MEGISSLLIALLILSIITEKAVLLIRCYPRIFAKGIIAILLILIVVLWLPFDLKDFLILPYIGFYWFIFYNYNSLNHRYETLTNKNKVNVHYINLIYAILFHTVLLLIIDSSFSPENLAFSAWNLCLFGLLTLFLQSLFHRDLLKNITKGENPEDTGSKELEVTFLSFLIGCTIAFLFSADIFDMLKSAMQSPEQLGAVFEFNNDFPIKITNDKSDKLNDFIKIDQSFNPFSKSTLGMLITGFFLSFGSKFFHDILEYVLELKNLKRKLNKKEAYKLEEIADIDEYIQTSETVMARKVSEDFDDVLKLEHPNIVSMQPGVSMIDGKKRNSVIIHLNDANSEGIPKKLPYRLSSGRVVDIPVEVISKLGEAEIHSRPGVKIADVKTPRKKGTYGCLVEHSNGNQYILTCSHVALGGRSENLNGVINENRNYNAWGTGKPPFKIADELFYARRDLHNDTALIKPTKGNNTNKSKGIEIGRERDVDTVNDHLMEVSFFGGKSGQQTGKIHQPCHTEEIEFKFEDGEKIPYKNLIIFGKLRNSSWTTISQKGDSGAIVFDKNNQALGLLIGGDKQFSYALPIKPILDKANCTINA